MIISKKVNFFQNTSELEDNFEISEISGRVGGLHIHTYKHIHAHTYRRSLPNTDSREYREYPSIIVK